MLSIKYKYLGKSDEYFGASLIDDGVCATDTDSFEDHLHHLAHCFVRLEANNMTLKMSKSLWGTKELPIVGHVTRAG